MDTKCLRQYGKIKLLAKTDLNPKKAVFLFVQIIEKKLCVYLFNNQKVISKIIAESFVIK